MAVRLALGAGRGRLIRQLLTESACLAVAGGLAGLVMARVLREGLLRLVADPTITLPSALDLRTLAFVFGLTLAVGLILGLLPALRITDTQPAARLREGKGVAGSAAWLRVGKLVVVGQLALSLPLLVGAGLLMRTLVNLQRVDLGYPTEGLLTVRVDADPAGYEPLRQTAAFEALLRAFAPSLACAPRPTRTTDSSATLTTAIGSPSRATRRQMHARSDRATTRSRLAISRRWEFPC